MVSGHGMVELKGSRGGPIADNLPFIPSKI